MEIHLKSSNKQVLLAAQKKFVKLLAGSTSPLPPALVFDIDGTLLINKKNDAQQRIPAAHEIYQWAIHNGVSVFFLTARPKFPDNRTQTDRDLVSAGYTFRKSLIMRPVAEYKADQENVSHFKAHWRHYIARFFHVLMSFGDKVTDLIEVSEPGRAPISQYQAQLLALNPNAAYLLRLPGNTAEFNVKLKDEK